MFSMFIIFIFWSESLVTTLKTKQYKKNGFVSLSTICFLYPKHLCRGVYSFRLSVRLFVLSYVRHVRGIYDKVFHRVAGKFLKWGIPHEPLIRKHSYLDHRYPGGSAFIPWLLTPGSMPQVGARGQNLGHLLKVFFLLSCYGNILCR